ncbi:MAG: cell division protein FtsX [Patescibacteria group bacterium]|nr:MAG: cell division protein FtsX [Patescibacteria group bacterium]
MNAFTTALTTIRRSPYQALTSILMVAVTFFVAYAFSIFMVGSKVVLEHFETQPQVLAFFELETKPEIIETVAKTMEEKPYVSSVKIISQEEALKLYQKDNSDDPLLLELVTADILPASVEVSGTDIDSLALIKKDLEVFTQVEDIEYQEDVITTLSNWITTIELTGLITTIVLGTISFLIIMVIIAMKANAQKKKIQIMRMLGATKWYIKAPYMHEGIIYGFVGALVGWFVMFATLLYLTPSINYILGDITLLPAPLEFYVIHALGGIILGMFLGAFASIVAVQRFIKN